MYTNVNGESKLFYLYTGILKKQTIVVVLLKYEWLMVMNNTNIESYTNVRDKMTD